MSHNFKTAILDQITHDCRTRWVDMHTAAASAAQSPAEQAQALIDTMDAAKLTGNRTKFYEAQTALKALVESEAI